MVFIVKINSDKFKNDCLTFSLILRISILILCYDREVCKFYLNVFYLCVIIHYHTLCTFFFNHLVHKFNLIVYSLRSSKLFMRF